MKVKEYLVNRILDLEKDLKQVRNEYAGVSYELSRRDNVINEQKKLIDDFQIEREHIKQIITCNLEGTINKGIYLDDREKDFDTLMAILDIKPEDYEYEDNNADKLNPPPACWGCKYEELEGNNDSCLHCFQGDKREQKEVTPDAETTD